MPIRPLPRRTFLRGLGGVAVALPALEIMMPRRAAAQGELPNRYVTLYAGTSIGRRINGGAATADMLVPDAVGPGYDLKRALLPLQDHAVADEVSVVSDLRIPWDEGFGIPPGGRPVQFHPRSLCPSICGVRSAPNHSKATGPTSEHVVADAIAGDTPHPVLAYRIQAAEYGGGSGDGGGRGLASYRIGATGELEEVTPVVSPRLAYESLFVGFTPPDPQEAALAALTLARRKSMIDLVTDQTEALLPRLGAVDRQRMERHFDELRALETRINAVEPPAEGSCELLPHPGEDPPIDLGTQDYDTEAGYSNEALRAEILTDLVHMAFACDLSRSASVMISYSQSRLNFYPIGGHTGTIHNLTHFPSDSEASPLERLSDSVGWHVGQLARLTAKLRDTPDVDGVSLLDRSALVLLFEGGHGYDPEGDDLDPHSTENMVGLIAGRAGGLNASGGQHIRATGQHPVNVVNSAMAAVGGPDTLGEVEGVVDELFA